MANEHRITDFDAYLFAQGNHYQIYEKLGAHPVVEDGKPGVYFAVWAPFAQAISVVTDYDGWDPKRGPVMTRATKSGIWDCFVPGMKPGDLYKYAVTGVKGETVLKADPYGNQSELRPGNASVVADLRNFEWQDKPWLENHKDAHAQKPMP